MDVSRDETNRPLSPDADLDCITWLRNGTAYYILKRPPLEPGPGVIPLPPPRSLEDILGVYTYGPYGRRKEDVNHSEEKYLLFVSFIK